MTSMETDYLKGLDGTSYSQNRGQSCRGNTKIEGIRYLLEPCIM